MNEKVKKIPLFLSTAPNLKRKNEVSNEMETKEINKKVKKKLFFLQIPPNSPTQNLKKNIVTKWE